MSEAERRYAAPHGSTAFPGATASDQPLADQPTEIVHTGGFSDSPDPRHDTVVGTAPVAYPPPRDDAPREPGFWAMDDEPATDDQRWDDGTATQPDYRDAPVVVRRADTLAGLLLLLG